MGRLFKREISLLVVSTSEHDFVSRVTVSNSIKITGLRVAFTIEKQLSKDPNSCELIVNNLSESTRSFLQGRPLKVYLSAGYDGELKQIFVGDVSWADSKRISTGWETAIRLGDGERAIKNARHNRSYISGTKLNSIVKDITESMGLRVPTSASDAVDLAHDLVSGTAVSGPSHRQLTQMLEAKGMRWSVQDDQMVILKNDETLPNASRVISAQTGMIGTPGFGTPEKKGKPPALSVSTLLYPELTPGGRIDLQSRTARGLFKIQSVRHSGDTHGTSWQTDVEANPI